MVASHNGDSIEATLSAMAARGVGARDGVLSGSCSAWRNHLDVRAGAAAGTRRAKYVPYGPVHGVMPYLIRRAQENGDLLGGVGHERGLLRTELLRRVAARN